MRTLLNFLENAVRSLRKIHPFSKDILRGTVQFSLLLSLFGLVMDRLAFETPDILRTLQYAPCRRGMRPGRRPFPAREAVRGAE